MSMQLKRRQAIIAGLSPLLPEEQVIAAIGVWDESYATNPAFNLQSYVDRLMEALAPTCQRRDLHRALVKSVFLGEAEVSAQEAPAEGTAPVENRVFEQLLGAFLTGVATQRPAADAAIRGYLIDKLGALPLAGAPQDAVAGWLARRCVAITAPLSREAMRGLLNLAYVLVCEYLGPMNADRLLSLAVKQTEGLPEARLLPPRTLL